MKKEYDFWANKRNIPNLELYTQLSGIIYGSLGINFLLCFLYSKLILNFELAGLFLILSISMFMLIPVVMSDPKKENRDLVAVVTYGIMHGMCTIGSAVFINFKELFIIYGIECLIVILLIVRNLKSNHRKGFKNF